MNDEHYRTRYPRNDTRDTRDTVERVRTYLLSRPTETWLFFIGGLLAGKLLG